MPRFIGAEESTEFGRAGAQHASAGQFDDAEFWFRRILGSWPGYAAGYADMGQLSFARSQAATGRDARARYRRDAEDWFRRAVETDVDNRLAGVRIPLARVLALGGDEHEALVLLDALLEQPALDASVRTDAEMLAADIRGGKALFSRASELGRNLVLEPSSKPLAPADRKDLEDARALLRQAADRNDAFATSWLLGKVEMRLGAMDAALDALRRAHSVDPDQPDGCRELCSAYLELGRADDALPLARRAVELRPDDAGLRCNLALVLLFVGDIESSRTEASAASSKDPADAITHGVIRLIDDVASGRRPRPLSLAEAEGRRSRTFSQER
jgi:tetratricopeptide (TPR) repeat protein